MVLSIIHFKHRQVFFTSLAEYPVKTNWNKKVQTAVFVALSALTDLSKISKETLNTAFPIMQLMSIFHETLSAWETPMPTHESTPPVCSAGLWSDCRSIWFFSHLVCIGCCGNDLDVCMAANVWCDSLTWNKNNKLPSRWKCVLSVDVTAVSPLRQPQWRLCCCFIMVMLSCCKWCKRGFKCDECPDWDT